jgi:subfamily B ATP-binding cassette protein MsbA
MSSPARITPDPTPAMAPVKRTPGKPLKSKDPSQFWRAARALWPYRKIIGISIVCAFFVGLAVSSGLTAMIPILRVLLKENQTVADWANEQIAEKRLGVKFSESGDELFRIVSDSPAEAAGLHKGDRLTDASNSPVSVYRSLSDPAVRNYRVTRTDVNHKTDELTIPLPPLQPHLAAGRNLAAHVSPRPVVAIAEIFAVLAALATFGNVLKFFQEYLSDKAAVSAVNDIRRRLYSRVLHLPIATFAKQNASEVTSRLVQDSAALEQGFKTVLGQSIQQPIIAAMAFAVALWTNWRLTLVIVVFAPVMGIIIQKFGKKMRRASRAALQKSSAMLGQIQATINGIRVVKGASAERFERRRYRTIMGRLVAEQLRMSRIDAFSSPTLETLTLLVVGAIVLIATYMVTETRTLSPEKFFLVMACLGTIADSLRRLNKVNNVLQIANSAATRIFEIMDLPVERERRQRRDEGRVEDGGLTIEGGAKGTNGTPRSSILHPLSSTDRPHRALIKLPPLQREVRFEDVTFTYPGGSSPAVIDVSLAVPKGRSVAIVGRNGSGKTTLLALLPRFYDPQQGRVLIDGVDVRDATLRSLRGQISIVTQDSVIFPGTVADNIAYGNPLASRDEIVAAAKRAFAHDFILEKPQGYDTLLGEMGGQLSGGQRQRVCIARAILRRAPILILDEATSQVDAESENLIQQAIDGLIHDRTAAGDATGPTTFIIAHRFSTILNADTIVVMDRARIVGQGRHDELLATCETYQQLYERQLFAAPAA